MAPPCAKGPRARRNAPSLAPVTTRTSTRRLARSRGFDRSSSSTKNFATPLSIAGFTLARVPSSAWPPARTFTGRPGRSCGAWTSATAASTRNESSRAIRAMISPRPTVAPSRGTTQVTTPSSSARAVASSSWCFAAASSFSRIFRPSAVPASLACVARRSPSIEASRWSSSIRAFWASTSASRSSPARHEPVGAQPAAAVDLRSEDLKVEAPLLDPVLQFVEAAFERDPQLRLLIALLSEAVLDPLDFEPGFGCVQLHDGVPGANRFAGPFQDPLDTRLHGARKHLLGSGDHRAGRFDHGLDVPALDPGGPDPGTAHGRSKPAGEAEHQDAGGAGEQERGQRPARQPPTPHLDADFTVHEPLHPEHSASPVPSRSDEMRRIRAIFPAGAGLTPCGPGRHRSEPDDMVGTPPRLKAPAQPSGAGDRPGAFPGRAAGDHRGGESGAEDGV